MIYIIHLRRLTTGILIKMNMQDLKGALDIATEKMTDYALMYMCFLTQVVNDAPPI